ncbi:MAG TPA: hypothetical protein VMR50_14135 [Myxococcota bacterium]|nr:hypothetical protein [Myxococcota bacterium]
MWKVAAFLLAALVVGHYGLRYVRGNPLEPRLEGSELAVVSRDHAVRFQRDGAFGGTYFVSDVESTDWSSEPVNLRLRVFEATLAREYMRGYPDFHLYGSDSSARVAGGAAGLSLIAANRGTYGDLRALLDRHEERASKGGERLCVTLQGESLHLVAARFLDDDHDSTKTVEDMESGSSVVYADRLDVVDCAALWGPSS